MLYNTTASITRLPHLLKAKLLYMLLSYSNPVVDKKVKLGTKTAKEGTIVLRTVGIDYIIISY